MFKIRYKLLLVILGVSLLPQLIMAQVGLKQVETIMNEKFDREADFASVSVQRYIQDIISTNESNINSLARNIQYVYNEDLNIVEEEMAQLVRLIQESSGSTPNLYVGTAKGEMIIYPEDQLPPGYDPRLRSWYQMANLARDKVNWFGPYIDQGTKQLVLTVSKYYNYKGQEGVLGIDIEMTDLRSEIETNVLGERGEMFIVDRLGEIILHNNPSFEGLNIKYTKYMDEGLNKALEIGQYKGDHYSFKALPISDNLYIVTAINLAEIRQLVNAQMVEQRTIPLVFVLFTLVISWYFSKKLTGTVTTIIDAMKKTEAGDYDVKLTYKGNDELAQMITQFNDMAESIRSNQEEMNALYEELSASEETLQDQYDELYHNREMISASERRYKLVFDASSEGLWDLDASMELKQYSPNWFKHYFIDIETNSWDDWTNLIHPDDRKMFLDSIDRHLQRLTPYINEVYRVRDLKGTYRIIQTRGKAEFNMENELITLAGSHLDVTEQKANEEQILRMAYFDEITGLANRRNFERELETYFSQHKWGRIIYLDIVSFKKINEDYGYQVGDRVLKDLAARIKSTFTDAYFARVAGDEFAVILGGLIDEELLAKQLSMLSTEVCCKLDTGVETLDYAVEIVQCKFPNEGKNADEIFSSLINKMKNEKNSRI